MPPSLLAAPHLRAGLAAGLLAAAAAAHAAAPALHVQRVEAIDRQGFERPMPAASMLLPAGWRTQAGLRWNVQTQCHPKQSVLIDAQAPDGSGRIQLVPGEGWGASSMGLPVLDCAPAAFGSAQEYLASWVQRHRPGARITGYVPRTDRQRPPRQYDMPGSRMSMRSELGRVQIAWTEQGRELHEIVATAVQISESELAGAGQVMRTRQGQAIGVLIWRQAGAPVDARRFDTLWDTFQWDPQWSARIAAGNAQMARENAETSGRIIAIQGQTGRDTINEMARRGESLRRDREEIASGQIRGYQNRDASTDLMQRDNVKQIREVEHYRGSDGRKVELPMHYPHAWKLKDGSFVLTDDPNFNPQVQLKLEGERLQRVR